MKRSAGSYSKHSRLLYSRGRVSVAKLLREFPVGSRARIKVNPRFRGAPHLKFNNRTGEIVGKRGNAFAIRIRDGGREKIFFAKNVHLEPV